MCVHPSPGQEFWSHHLPSLEGLSTRAGHSLRAFIAPAGRGVGTCRHAGVAGRPVSIRIGKFYCRPLPLTFAVSFPAKEAHEA